jgi:hypothetical protein
VAPVAVAPVEVQLQLQELQTPEVAVAAALTRFVALADQESS